jgi:hypothetical protein
MAGLANTSEYPKELAQLASLFATAYTEFAAIPKLCADVSCR